MLLHCQTLYGNQCFNLGNTDDILRFCFYFVSAIELDINVLDARKPYLPFEEFYNEPLSDTIEMDIDFANYKTEISNGKWFLFNKGCNKGSEK